MCLITLFNLVVFFFYRDTIIYSDMNCCFCTTESEPHYFLEGKQVFNLSFYCILKKYCNLKVKIHVNV